MTQVFLRVILSIMKGYLSMWYGYPALARGRGSPGVCGACSPELLTLSFRI